MPEKTWTKRFTGLNCTVFIFVSKTQHSIFAEKECIVILSKLNWRVNEWLFRLGVLYCLINWKHSKFNNLQSSSRNISTFAAIKPFTPSIVPFNTDKSSLTTESFIILRGTTASFRSSNKTKFQKIIWINAYSPSFCPVFYGPCKSSPSKRPWPLTTWWTASYILHL